jgi:glycosyltransferase involved in cell wall biosynthesis
MNAPDALSILLVGDYPEDPTLGSPKVLFKLQAEYRALGHRCEIVFDRDIGGSRIRHIRQLMAPWNAGQAIVQRLDRDHYDVVDAASAEGLWLGVLKRFGAYRRTLYICRSNGLEHLNYRRMLDDHAAGLSWKPWTRRIWYPVSRLTQVAAAARLADRLVLLNEGDREFALDHGWIPPDRVEVVPHGVSKEFLDDDPGAKTRRGAGLLFCGSWDQTKGIAYLVAAFDKIHRSGGDMRLTILGPGVPEGTVLHAFPERLRPFVTVMPRAPEARVIELYRSHDLLIWPSTYEGFGLVLLEAMSQRLPAIATPVGCARSIVRDGQTGIRVPPRDPDAIAAAAQRLMADEGLRVRIGDAARQAVAGMTWRATALRTLDLYRRARAERRAA